MSETLDLTVLSGLVQETAREARLMRLQVDNLASRFAGMEQRVSVLEQSFHDLVGEVSRGFSQVQQRATRHEKRLDAVDAGWTWPTARRGYCGRSRARTPRPDGSGSEADRAGASEKAGAKVVPEQIGPTLAVLAWMQVNEPARAARVAPPLPTLSRDGRLSPCGQPRNHWITPSPTSRSMVARSRPSNSPRT